MSKAMQNASAYADIITSFPAALSGLKLARGVTVLPIDALDWVNEGVLSDGLHPNDLGNDRLASVVVEALV